MPFETHRHDKMHHGLVPTAQLGTGTADATTFLRGDQTYGVPPSVVTAAQIRDAGRWEVVMTPGIASPPEPLTNEAGDDWLYAWVPG